MPVNYFPNASEAELVALLESVQRRDTVGEVSFATIPGGGQIQRSVQGAKDVELTMRRILYALFLLNPSTYDNPYVGRIRKTMPYYV